MLALKNVSLSSLATYPTPAIPLQNDGITVECSTLVLLQLQLAILCCYF